MKQLLDLDVFYPSTRVNTIQNHSMYINSLLKKYSNCYIGLKRFINFTSRDKTMKPIIFLQKSKQTNEIIKLLTEYKSPPHLRLLSCKEGKFILNKFKPDNQKIVKRFLKLTKSLFQHLIQKG